MTTTPKANLDSYKSRQPASQSLEKGALLCTGSARSFEFFDVSIEE